MVQNHKVMLVLGLLIWYVGEAANPVRKQMVSGNVGADVDADFSDIKEASFVRKQVKADGNIDASDVEAERSIRKHTISWKVGANGEVGFSGPKTSLVRKQMRANASIDASDAEAERPIRKQNDRTRSSQDFDLTELQSPDSFTTSTGLTFTGYGPGSSQTEGGKNWSEAKAFCEAKGARLATAEEAIEYKDQFNNAKQGHCCYWLADQATQAEGNGISDSAFSSKMTSWRAFAQGKGVEFIPDQRNNEYSVEPSPNSEMCLNANDYNTHFEWRKCGHSRNTMCVSTACVDCSAKSRASTETGDGSFCYRLNSMVSTNPNVCDGYWARGRNQAKRSPCVYADAASSKSGRERCQSGPLPCC